MDAIRSRLASDPEGMGRLMSLLLDGGSQATVTLARMILGTEDMDEQGLAEEEINLLPTLTFTSQGQEAGDATPGGERGRVQCQICLLDLEDGDCLRSIPCRHHFHSRCLDEWLKIHATCPLCRQDLRPQRQD